MISFTPHREANTHVHTHLATLSRYRSFSGEAYGVNTLSLRQTRSSVCKHWQLAVTKCEPQEKQTFKPFTVFLVLNILY